MRHSRSGFFQILWVLIFLSILPGCWDLEEVDRRAFATTVGIDTNPDHQVFLTVQIPIPQKMLPPGAGGAGAAAPEGKNFTIAGVMGQSVGNAFHELQTKTSRRLVIQQNKSIIIGEDAARGGISELIDWFSRSAKAPPQALVFITNGKSARDILTFTSPQMVLPGLEFIAAGLSVAKYDQTYFIPVWQFAQRIFYKIKDAYAPLIDVGPKEGNYQISGLAVFNGTKMAGKLDAKESQCFGLLTGQLSSGGMSFGEDLKVSLRNVQGRTEIKVIPRGGGFPDFMVKTMITASLDERTDQKTNLDAKDIEELENQLAQSLKARISPLISKLQALNADVIDFGEQFRIQQPKIWEETDWKKIFPKVPFQVAVNISLQKDGVLR